jgi:transposase
VKIGGTDEVSGLLFSYVDLDERIPARHPLRKIRLVVNEALASLDAEFDAIYNDFGQPSIAPERLIRASLIQILFSVRSERQLMEQMQYNLLFRWFVGLGIDDPVWVPTVFTKNRDRLLTTDMSRKVMSAILAHREVAPLFSDDHFSVDGTLVKAWASMKSFQPKAEGAPPKDEGPGDPPGVARGKVLEGIEIHGCLGLRHAELRDQVRPVEAVIPPFLAGCIRRIHAGMSFFTGPPLTDHRIS